MADIIKKLVPSFYTGRCNKDFLSSFLQAPIDGHEAERFEIRLPKVRTHEESLKAYGLTRDQMFDIAVKSLSTRVDSKAKDIMFGLDSKTGEHRGYTTENHLAAQQYVDRWRTGADKPTKAFLALVAKNKELGLLPHDANPETELEMAEMIKAHLSA